LRDNSKGQIEKQIQNDQNEISRELRALVAIDNESVKLGLQNLRMFCQIKRIKHDQIENHLFVDYKPEQKVSILEMQVLLTTKLDMSEEDAFVFARYLVEPRENEILKPNPSMTTAACKVVVKIMKQLGELLIQTPEETLQNIGILKKSLTQMTHQDLHNKISTYQPPNLHIIKMPTFNQIFKIDEKVRLSCFIELCR